MIKLDCSQERITAVLMNYDLKTLGFFGITEEKFNRVNRGKPLHRTDLPDLGALQNTVEILPGFCGALSGLIDVATYAMNSITERAKKL